MTRGAVALVVWIAAVAPVLAEEAMQPIAVNPEALKFTTPPGLPLCAKATALRGDPTKQASVLFAEIGAGCRIPWHWHTAGEQLMIANGNGMLEIKGEKPLRLLPGAYAFLPGHHVHRFACFAACTIFNTTEDAFDIHYVDDAGNEIPAADALKPTVEKR